MYTAMNITLSVAPPLMKIPANPKQGSDGTYGVILRIAASFSWFSKNIPKPFHHVHVHVHTCT